MARRAEIMFTPRPKARERRQDRTRTSGAKSSARSRATTRQQASAWPTAQGASNYGGQGAAPGWHRDHSYQTPAFNQPQPHHNTWRYSGFGSSTAPVGQRPNYVPHPYKEWLDFSTYQAYCPDLGAPTAAKQASAWSNSGNMHISDEQRIRAYNPFDASGIGFEASSESLQGAKTARNSSTKAKTRSISLPLSVSGGYATGPPPPPAAAKDRDPKAWQDTWNVWSRDAILVDGWRKLSWRQIGYSLDARTGTLIGGPMELAWTDYGQPSECWPAVNVPDAVAAHAVTRYGELYLGATPPLFHHQRPVYEPLHKISVPPSDGSIGAAMWLY